ncbi:MAG: OmpA family protein [Pseudomonadota bacterium]
MEASSASVTTQRAHTTQRYYRRVPDPGALPWWWWLLLALALLLFLFATLVMARQVQRDVAREAGDQLSAAGIEVLSSAADGQRVALRATGHEDAVDRYGWIAESARCDTWAGRLRCPTLVSVAVEAPPAPPAVIEAPPRLASPAVPRPYHLRLSAVDDALRLTGQVPSDTVRDTLVSEARARFDRVDDQLVVVAPAPEQNTSLTAPAGTVAMAILGRLIRGEAHWLDGTLSIAGIADQSVQSEVTLAFSDAADEVPTGQLWLQVARDATDCNAEFANLLRNATIHFATASAEIPAQDDPLLAALASLAKQCPGDLLVEGHTDNVGNAEANQALSAARASAVVNALTTLGVGAARLSSQGLGETTPIATNETASGRAQNRRIVVRLRDASATRPTQGSTR